MPPQLLNVQSFGFWDSFIQIKPIRYLYVPQRNAGNLAYRWLNSRPNNWAATQLSFCCLYFKINTFLACYWIFNLRPSSLCLISFFLFGSLTCYLVTKHTRLKPNGTSTLKGSKYIL